MPFTIEPNYYLLSFASLWFSTLLAAGATNSVPEIACASAGVLGGAITQLLTMEKRKPSRRVILGEMLCSAVAGFSTYAGIGDHEPKTLVAAIIAGGAGAALWHKSVNLVIEYKGKSGDGK